MILSEIFEITIDELVKEGYSDTVIGKKKEEEEEEEDDDFSYSIIGGVLIGMALMIATGNAMWSAVGIFLGLGLNYILKGMR